MKRRRLVLSLNRVESETLDQLVEGGLHGRSREEAAGMLLDQALLEYLVRARAAKASGSRPRQARPARS